MNPINELLEKVRPEMNFMESEDFVEGGFLDSFDIFTLVAEIDKKYLISIDGEDIIPENFKNIKTISDLLRKYGVNV